MNKKIVKANLHIGTDGRKRGWVTAAPDRGELRLEKFASIGDIIRSYPEYDEFLLDISAIGKRSTSGYCRV